METTAVHPTLNGQATSRMPGSSNVDRSPQKDAHKEIESAQNPNVEQGSRPCASGPKVQEEQDATIDEIFQRSGLSYSFNVSQDTRIDWENKLKPKVRDIVRTTTYNGPFVLDFALTGRTRIYLTSSILILVTHEQHVKQVKRAFKEPQFQTFRDSLRLKKIKVRVLLDPKYGSRSGGNKDDSDAGTMSQIMDIPSSLPLKLALSIIHEEGSTRRTFVSADNTALESQNRFTIVGGTVEINGELYGLTTGHPFFIENLYMDDDLSISETASTPESSLNISSDDDAPEDCERDSVRPEGEESPSNVPDDTFWDELEASIKSTIGCKRLSASQVMLRW